MAAPVAFRRAIGLSVLALVLLLLGMLPAPTASQSPCQFALGYRALRDQIPAVDAVFLGDSHFGFWDVGAALAPARVANRGVPGQTSAEILARFTDDVSLARPRSVFILAGANDAVRRLPTDGAKENLVRLLDQAREQRIATYVVTVPPMRAGSQISADNVWDVNRRIGELDDWIRASGPDHGATVVDLYRAVVDDRGELDVAYARSDGIHLNPSGYARLAALVKPFLPSRC